MSKKFILEIDLGNDAMQSGFDIAKLLQGPVADRVVSYTPDGLKVGLSSGVLDRNGTKVGRWRARARTPGRK